MPLQAIIQVKSCLFHASLRYANESRLQHSWSLLRKFLPDRSWTSAKRATPPVRSALSRCQLSPETARKDDKYVQATPAIYLLLYVLVMNVL